MTSTTVTPSAAFRKRVRERGAASASNCFQCATCSSVCDLTSADRPYPRTQMLYAQWGLEDKIVEDPSIWLCHQCNDCTAKCPRDAKPGDVMQTLRARTIEHLAPIRVLGSLVGNIKATWPIVIGLPMSAVIAAVYAASGLAIPEPLVSFEAFVPHALIHAVFIPALTLGVLLLGVGGLRAWRLWGNGVERKGSFIAALFCAFTDIVLHRKFSTCTTARPRRTGHFLVMWGFIGAFVTTSLVVVWLALLDAELPFPLTHPLKIIGNLAGLSLLLGGVFVLLFRAKNAKDAGASFAFDNFFLFLILAIGLTGVTTELFRAIVPIPVAACISYLIHLGFILTLFLSLPYCKFAHFVYRTLAMTHENMRTKRS